jgi:hypothetical protein
VFDRCFIRCLHAFSDNIGIARIPSRLSSMYSVITFLPDLFTCSVDVKGTPLSPGPFYGLKNRMLHNSDTMNFQLVELGILISKQPIDISCNEKASNQLNHTDFMFS